MGIRPLQATIGLGAPKVNQHVPPPMVRAPALLRARPLCTVGRGCGCVANAADEVAFSYSHLLFRSISAEVIICQPWVRVFILRVLAIPIRQAGMLLAGNNLVMQ